jgi:hypothetical protein
MQRIVFTHTGPNPKQRLFLTSQARYTCYGGARGGGKTWAVIAKAVLLCLNPDYAGIRVLILRRKLIHLEETLAAPISRLVPRELGSYNAEKNTFFFKNGSTIRFGHLHGRRDLEDYQGREYDVVFIDEATQFTEAEFRTLGACVRGVNAFPKRVYLTCNPGGIGHRWVRRLFLKREFLPDENPDDYLFVPATVFDNRPLLDASPDYLRMLNLLPESLRRAHRDGDWDALSGQFFSEFDPALHTAKPFPVPPGWTRYRALDYGLDMLACLWIAVDYEGRAWVYREYQMGKDIPGGRGLLLSEAAEMIRSMTLPGEEILCTLAPPDLWSAQKDTGRSAAEVFAAHGVPLTRAVNARAQGWLMLKEYLRINPGGSPPLLIFNTCPQLIENLPQLQVSEKNPNDCDIEPHAITHICDALRYFAAQRILTPEPGQRAANAGQRVLGDGGGGFDIFYDGRRDRKGLHRDMKRAAGRLLLNNINT